MKTAIAIRHLAFEDLGTLADVLEQRGIAIRYFDAGVDDFGALSAASFDLAVVLGGPIGAYEVDQYPFLTQETAWLRNRLTSDLPTLGICLGAQLMAAALGARVYGGGAGKEIGWAPLLPGADAAQSACLAPLLEKSVAVLHWHGDTFDLPTVARHLAASASYPNQAFAWRRNGLALQFHLEVQALRLERWLIGHACEISGVPGLTPNVLRQATKQHAPTLERVAPLVWNTWLDSLV